MHINKQLKLLVFAISLSIMSVIPTFASPTNAKVGNYSWENVNDKWTCFNEDGASVIGWIVYEDEIYYLGKDGVMRTGWIKDGGSWYYLDEESGALLRNRWVDNYFVDKNGKMTKVN